MAVLIGHARRHSRDHGVVVVTSHHLEILFALKDRQEALRNLAQVERTRLTLSGSITSEELGAVVASQELEVLALQDRKETLSDLPEVERARLAFRWSIAGKKLWVLAGKKLKILALEDGKEPLRNLA